MSSAAPLRRRATLADFLAIPEAERYHELIDGEIVRKGMPTMRHGRAQLRVSTRVSGPYDRRPGRGGPGGWIFANEVEILFNEVTVLRPDVSGWRRERLPVLADEHPVGVRPDWVCEVLSPSNPGNDLLKKIRVYQRAQVPHYWIVDPVEESLIVYRWTPEGYLLVASSSGDERVRLEPFDAVEVSAHLLVALEEDDEDDAPGEPG